VQTIEVANRKNGPAQFVFELRRPVNRLQFRYSRVLDWDSCESSLAT
jgi:hypothetical protein